MATTATMYDRLTKQLDMVPSEDEGEQDFLVRTARAINELDEAGWEKLDEDIQVWYDEAAIALEHKKPIQLLPGSPFKDGEDTAAEEPMAPRRRGGRKAAAPAAEPEPPKARGRKPAAPAPAAEPEAPKRRGRKPAAEPSEPAEPKAARRGKAAPAEAPRRRGAAPTAEAPKRAGRKPSTDKGPGVLDLLMVATYHNPSDTPAQLKSRVESANKGMVVQEANAIGVRQQYRRIVRFLQRMAHEDKKWDGNILKLETE